MTIIDVGEWGANLLSRDRAARIRAYIEERTRSSDELVFDFAGVSSLSPSFADECFGVLVSELAGEPDRPVVRLTNMTADVRAMLRFAIFRRLGADRQSA